MDRALREDQQSQAATNASAIGTIFARNVDGLRECLRELGSNECPEEVRRGMLRVGRGVRWVGAVGGIWLFDSLGREVVDSVVANLVIGQGMRETIGRIDKKGERYRGSGLGLSISRRLGALLRRDIIVEREVGVDSAFTLWLPTLE